ncbi:MAG: hypothetical protein HY303_20220 [Candidatus Wallbacteria bacterium]|nr:hypothetical protein [Candidatus Wallbacteria bacterium]
MRGPAARRSVAAALALMVLMVLYRLDPGRETWILPEPASSVQRVRIEAEGRWVEFERTGPGWRAVMTQGVISEGAGPGYRGVASPGVEDVGARVGWVLGRLCERDAPTLSAELVRGAPYGLEPPRVRLTLTGRRTYHLSIGGLNPAGDGRYFRLEEPARAGLLPRDVAGEIAGLAGGGPQH